MAKLLFDGTATQSSSRAKFHGGGEYAKFVLTTAIQRGNTNFDIVFNENLITDLQLKSFIDSQSNINVYYVRSKEELYELIDKNGYERFYSALPMDYVDYHGKALFIMVIHGLRSIELPWDEFRYKYYAKTWQRILLYFFSGSKLFYKYLRKKHIKAIGKLISVPNNRIITVSEHSKYSILSFFSFLDPVHIHVFYSPFSLEKVELKDSFSTANYYLMISANRYEKNIYRAMLAFDFLFSNNFLEEKKVVILGSTNYPFFSSMKNQSRFDLLPYVEYEELNKLFQNAYAFVYPSLNEGFGYPPIVAMNYGIPVLASSSTSIPEVCADAAIYFNPLSIDDMANRILQINDRPDLYKDVVAKGQVRVSELSCILDTQMDEMLQLIFK